MAGLPACPGSGEKWVSTWDLRLADRAKDRTRRVQIPMLTEAVQSLASLHPLNSCLVFVASVLGL